VLEIGPGLGLLGRILQQNFDYFAADIVPNYLMKLGLKPGRSFLWDVTAGGLTEEFDLIIACDVFEHVLNEGDAWLSVSKALKPGGIFYIRVPHREPLINYTRLLGAPYPYVHLRSYSLGYLKEMSLHCGFTVRKISRTYDHQSYYARRGYGVPFLKKAHSRALVFQLKSAYSGTDLDSGDSTPIVSKFRKFPLSSLLKLILNLFGPGVQSILRKSYNALLKSTAGIFFRPSEIAVILEKNALQKRFGSQSSSRTYGNKQHL